jgi:hypothetical protein
MPFVGHLGSTVRRDQLEHLIRAAGSLLGEDTIVVIGSQAILASMPEPEQVALVRSMEADLLPLDDPDETKADLIDGVLGAGSMFDDTHGIHADGVSAATAVLPAGWQDRLIEVCNANTNGVRGLCLEPHDLVVSKLAAGRDKDREFCAAALQVRLIDLEILQHRLADTVLDQTRRDRVAGWISTHRPTS